MTKEGKEKARYIENREGIAISHTHFISREGAKHHDMPSYWVSDGSGVHIQVVKYEKEYFLTQTTMSDYGHPIPYSQSGRIDGRQDTISQKESVSAAKADRGGDSQIRE